MSVTGTFNGASILAFPTSPAPKSIQLTMNNIVASPTNPFTGAPVQVQAWPGGDFWTADIALPKLLPADAAVWKAFLAECRGALNVFRLSDPAYKGPQGNPSGAPVCNDVTNAYATTLATRGWTPNMFRLLLPGDYLQLGNYLHRVLEQVNSDANGDATISLWPSIRVATTDGETINLNNPTGLFRMRTNQQSVLTDETRLSGVSLQVVEAR